jgi:hypothetical protein
MAKFSIADWEKRYNYEKDRGLLVNVNNDITIDRRSIQSVEGGIYTKELGSLSDTDKDIREFSCECGALYGRFYEGEICPDCETPVKEQYGTDIRRVGWIDIDPYYIINPNAYELIAKVIGNKKFQSIIAYDVQLDIDGFAETVNTLAQPNKTTPFANISIMGFYKRYEEILNYFGTIRGMQEEVAYLIAHKDSVFSTKIPVTTVYLRPTFTSSKKRSVSFDKINAIYVEILSNTNILKRTTNTRNKVSSYSILFQIQLTLQKLYDFVIRSKLSGKTKIIRAQVLGTRMSFSSRMVIRSNVGKYSGIDHVVISYKAFLELYYLEIINCMRRGYGDEKFKNMTIYEILEYLTRVRYSSEVDEAVYKIIQLMIEKRGDSLRVLINRNPTLDLGSIQCMKIVHVTKNARDFTMAIPLTSLAPLCGDFDGDVLNVHALKEKSVIDAFNEGFNPRNLMIDRTGDSYFNGSLSIIKDMLTNLIEFVKPFDE